MHKEVRITGAYNEMAIDIQIMPYGNGVFWDADLTDITYRTRDFFGRTKYGYLISNKAKLAGIGIEDTIRIKKFQIKKRW